LLENRRFEQNGLNSFQENERPVSKMTSIVLMDLNRASLDICDAFEAGKEIRLWLIQEWSYLESVCYEDYLDGTSNNRVTPQVEYQPLLDNIRKIVKELYDAPKFLALIDNWVLCYDAYSTWLQNDPISREDLNDMWLSQY